METTRYLRALSRSWWLVVVTLIVGGAAGYLVYRQATPMYESSGQLIVGSPGSNAVNTQLENEAVAGQLAALAGTNPAAERAFVEAGRPAGGFSVTTGTSGQFITITVTSTNNLTAARMANAYLATIRSTAANLGTTGTYKLTTDFLASPEDAPFTPDRTKDVGIGIAAGLVVGVVLAILREALNRTVRDSDSLSELTGLVGYGTVPRAARRELLPARNDPRSARSEAYRQIRTSILNRTIPRPLVVAVTSATDGEGKTSVATNLAAILARAGHRVVIVDADLRRPRVHTYYGIDAAVGLTNVLKGTASLDDAVVGLDDGVLGVLPAGPASGEPSELLGSVAMQAALRQLSESFEFVIVDTPSVLGVSDALVVGPRTDGVLLVTRLQRTTSKAVMSALQRLDRANAELLGVVPNMAP